VFFLAEDLSGTKPIPEEDRLEWVLGVVLVHYSIKAGIKKFQDRGKAGVNKELTQMHVMEVFSPVMRDLLTKEERTKNRRVTDVPQQEKGPLGKGKNMHRRTKTERALDKTGHDIPHYFDGGSHHHRGS
jgi:hypothetical protein